ncbi:5198_t:CDS:1, partial [Paraglomus occultum]
AKTDSKQVSGNAFGYDARYFNTNFVLVQNWLYYVTFSAPDQNSGYLCRPLYAEFVLYS